MDYEKKYKKALENFKKIKNANNNNKKLVNFIECEYPELRESKDERISKAIITWLKSTRYVPNNQVETLNSWIAWLEKQGEQKSWSEEDEKILKRIDNLLYSQCTIHGSEYEKLHNWLKSLKPNHWKPSEEQMSMLLAVLNDSNNITSESVQIALKSLYNDLKNL